MEFMGLVLEYEEVSASGGEDRPSTPIRCFQISLSVGNIFQFEEVLLVNRINVGICIEWCDLFSLFTVMVCGFSLSRVLVRTLSPVTGILFQCFLLHQWFCRFVQFLGLFLISWVIVQSLGVSSVGWISLAPDWFEVLGCFEFGGMI